MNLKIKISYLCLYLGILFSSCGNNNSNKIYKNEYTHKVNIKYTEFKCKKYKLKGFDSSGVGKIVINNNKILYMDDIFNVVYRCNLKGYFENIVVERGKGPKDIIGCGYYTKTKSNYFFITKNGAVSKMNKSWEREKVYMINLPIKHTVEEITYNPSLEYTGIYELNMESKNICDYDSDNLLIPIITDHFKINGFGTNSDKFYKESYMFGIMNKNTGEVNRMIGHRSDIYLKKKYIPNFNWFSFTKINNRIYVSFAADPKIQIMDLDGKNVARFGIKGKDMNTNYRETKIPQIALDNCSRDLVEFDYYRNLKFIPETNLLFRTYKKQLKDKDGMQIYKNKTLIGDVNVPLGFRIVGYAKGKYYAQGKSRNDDIIFYSFTLN